MNLTEKQEFDVLIIGGGIVGLSIARELNKRGIKRIAVFQSRFDSPNTASHAAAGMLAPQGEVDANNEFFGLCAASRDLYTGFANELFEETGVDVELERSGSLHLAFDENDLQKLEKRFEWQTSAKLEVEKLTRQEVLEIEPNLSDKVLGALRFPNDWQVENRNILGALQRYCLEETSSISDFYEADSIKFKGNRINVKEYDKKVTPLKIKLLGKTVIADKVVIASGAWSSKLDFPFDVSALKVKPIRGQMISFRSDEQKFRHVINTPRGYIVPRRGRGILVGATVEDVGFNRSVTANGLNYLTSMALEISPQFGELKFEEAWCGFRPKTSDGFPLLGEFPANSGLFWATGHYRNGILLAPVTAKLIADKIVDNVDSPFLETFSPNRF